MLIVSAALLSARVAVAENNCDLCAPSVRQEVKTNLDFDATTWRILIVADNMTMIEDPYPSENCHFPHSISKPDRRDVILAKQKDLY